MKSNLTCTILHVCKRNQFFHERYYMYMCVNESNFPMNDITCTCVWMKPIFPWTILHHVMYMCEIEKSFIVYCIYLCVKESHSRRKRLVFSTPSVSQPQCSNPWLTNLFIISNLSPEEMSQWRRSFNSVNIHGLINAPLRKLEDNFIDKTILCQIPRI